MVVPSRIVLPFHHDDGPVPWSESRVFTPASPDWDVQLGRWAVLNGFMPDPGESVPVDSGE